MDGFALKKEKCDEQCVIRLKYSLLLGPSCAQLPPSGERLLSLLLSLPSPPSLLSSLSLSAPLLSPCALSLSPLLSPLSSPSPLSPPSLLSSQAAASC